MEAEALKQGRKRKKGGGRKSLGLVRKTVALPPEIWAEFNDSAISLQEWIVCKLCAGLPVKFGKSPGRKIIKSEAEITKSEAEITPEAKPVQDGKITLTAEQRAILKAMLSGCDLFVSGGAGVGKSVLIREFAKAYKSSVILCAPTGVAAVNIGGATLHSVFRLPKKDIFMEEDREEIYDAVFRYDPKDRSHKSPWLDALHGASCFIIDEISMCRGDTFSMVMACIRALRDKGLKVQVIVVGDFHQLPPVLGDKKSFIMKDTGKKVSQKEQYKEIYGNSSGYCFLTEDWKFEKCVLNQVMRQADGDFSRALNQVRIGDEAGLDYIFFHSSKEPLDAVWICGRNDSAEMRNNRELEKLKGKRHSFPIVCNVLDGKQIKWEELQNIARNTAKGDLVIKRGAAVVALVNAYDENGNALYCNGSRGIVKRITENDEVFVDFGSGPVEVAPYTWEEKRYVYDPKTRKSDGKIVGTFRKVPLVLGYATTVHKSQGQTLDAINIDRDCNWQDGQLYVALSRAKLVDRIYIEGRPKPRVSREVLDFYGGTGRKAKE